MTFVCMKFKKDTDLALSGSSFAKITNVGQQYFGGLERLIDPEF
ncbi:MAG: hypothetical protein ACFFG0_43265 [Candidatus Thorarchaeota archaeon]